MAIEHSATLSATRQQLMQEAADARAELSRAAESRAAEARQELTSWQQRVAMVMTVLCP